MLAVVFPCPDEFTLADVPEPAAGAGQVVVRVKSTTICATDFKIFHGQFPGVTFPHIPGHEWGGEVADVGAGVTGLQPGLSQAEWFAYQGLCNSFIQFLSLTGVIQYKGKNKTFAFKFTRSTYDRYCLINKAPKDLIELGWQEYLKYER